MPERKTTKPDSLLENCEPQDDSALLETVADLEPDEQEEEKAPVQEAPTMTDPAWSDYVLSKFQPDEVDNEGNPFVAGLRRVARLLLGPIIESTCQVITAPHVLVDEVSGGKLSVATVVYKLKFLWCRPEDLAEGQGAIKVKFSDVADVFYGNTELEFARYPCSTAATRAEARCLRKALQLQRVIAAEEKTKVPLEESGVNGVIAPSQVQFIVALCKRCDISVLGYINAGSRKYKSIDDVPHGTAAKMIQHLSSLQNDPTKIPDDVKGYDPNWKK